MKSTQNLPETPLSKCHPELFETVQQASVAQAVVNQLEQSILDGVLKSGMQLPAERVLAEQLGVSRPKLREALQLLEQRGLLVINPGSGAIVAQLSGDVMTQPLVELYCRHPKAIQDHLEYRKSQEMFAAQLASERATQEDKRGIGHILEQMTLAEQHCDLALALELDAQLHMAIVHASHNRTLIHMMEALYSLNRSGMFFSRGEMLSQQQCAHTLYSQHQQLGKAIISSDAAEAVRLSAEHIDFVVTTLTKLLEQQQREALAAKRYG